MLNCLYNVDYVVSTRNGNNTFKQYDVKKYRKKRHETKCKNNRTLVWNRDVSNTGQTELCNSILVTTVTKTLNDYV